MLASNLSNILLELQKLFPKLIFLPSPASSSGEGDRNGSQGYVAKDPFHLDNCEFSHPGIRYRLCTLLQKKEFGYSNGFENALIKFSFHTNFTSFFFNDTNSNQDI